LHALAPDPGVSWRLVAVHFHAEIYQGVNLLELLNFPLHYPADPDAPYRPASQALAREFALRQPGWRRAASAELLRVLTHLIRAHGNRLRVAGTGGGPAQLPRLAPALRFVDEHLDEPGIPVALLAERLHLSEVRFWKIFKQVLGLSPVRFIQRRRVERACALLRATDLTVDQIAYRCGFTDSPFFCRVFRQWMKTTPARYRNEGRI
jgi:AraC-like DNA-binding protein